MKKLISLALACMMALSMITSAAAVDEGQKAPAGEGTITITGIHLDEHGDPHTQYRVYKMLNLKSYDSGDDAYIYEVEEAWRDFFDPEKGYIGSQYISVDKKGIAKWINDSKEDSVVADFAQAALAYAKEKIGGVERIAADLDSRVHVAKWKDDDKTKELIQAGYNLDTALKSGTFYGLELGYYLVDSNVGALCGLTTTRPDGLIGAKNSAPTLEKQAQEDDNGSWHGTGSTTDADIGQFVNYKITIDVKNGAENYVFHDKLSEGLTFYVDPDDIDKSVTVQYGVPNNLNQIEKYEPVDKAYYDVIVRGGENDDELCDEDCTFEVKFTDEFCADMNTNDEVIITYGAILNEKALKNDEATNDAWLEYGEGHHTTHDSVTTVTYGFEIVKTDGDRNLLDGAVFKLYNENPYKEVDGKTEFDEDATPIPLVKCEENGEVYYRRAMPTENAANTPGYTTEIEVADGRVKVRGLDDSTYWLYESVEPAGYNRLEYAKRIDISNGNQYATVDDEKYMSGGVWVENNKGDKLPETGAAGTAMFIGFGSILVLATGLLLVTKKRMSMIED